MGADCESHISLAHFPSMEYRANEACHLGFSICLSRCANMWMILWISPTSRLPVPSSSNIAAHILPIRSKSGLRRAHRSRLNQHNNTRRGYFHSPTDCPCTIQTERISPEDNNSAAGELGVLFGFISNKHRSLPHSASHPILINRGRPTRFACGKRSVS